MYLEYVLSNCFYVVYARKHLCSCVYNRVFKPLLLNGFSVTFCSLFPARQTNIVIVNISRMRSAAFSTHFVFAIPAHEFAG